MTQAENGVSKETLSEIALRSAEELALPPSVWEAENHPVTSYQTRLQERGRSVFGRPASQRRYS